MSLGLTHFSMGATLSLLIFRAIDYNSKRVGLDDYLRYDILIAFMGGLWAMIPDIPALFGVFDELFGSTICNLFFFHCWMDAIDPKDTIMNSVIMFGILLLIINLINFEIGITEKKKRK